MKRIFAIILTLALGFVSYSQGDWYDNCDANIVVNQDTLIYNDTIKFYGYSDTVLTYASSRNDFFEIRWTGDNGNLNTSNPTTNVTVPLGTYRTDTLIISFRNPDNLIQNGNFELGDWGFTSSLIAVPESTTPATSGTTSSLWQEGKYGVGLNPRFFHSNWVSATHDGKMMIVNGSGVPNTPVYTKSFPVTPYTYYTVFFEAANIDQNADNGNIASFQFQIDGQTVGDIFAIPVTLFNWGTYYQVWNSGDNTTSTITILNQNTALSGNDFAIDNIEVHQVCYLTKFVTIQNRAMIYDTTIATICDGESYDFMGKTYTTAGIYTDTTISQTTCSDTIAILDLRVEPSYDTLVNAKICQGEAYAFNGINHTATGEYKYELQSVYGCDSILTLNLVVSPLYDTTIYEGICNGDSYTSSGFNESQSGIYEAQLTSSAGCDSIVRLNLTVFPTFDIVYKEQIEEGMVYTQHGFNESETGVYIHEGVSIHGCDSTTTLDLFVKKVPIIYIPNVFTPSKDSNNIFRIFFADDDTKVESFAIFNRWGTKMFETNDIREGWDGTFNGAECETGIYVYHLLYYGNDKILREKVGEVMLLH